MAANSATAIPNAGMGAGTNNASAIVFRPIVWGDLDAVVDLFDRTWPQDVDKVGADMSRLISRYFVLHYLLPTTFANGAFAADGTLAGVTFIRVAGEAPQLDEIEVGEEMKALERRIDADPEAAKHMAALKSGFSVELDLERQGRRLRSGGEIQRRTGEKNQSASIINTPCNPPKKEKYRFRSCAPI